MRPRNLRRAGERTGRFRLAKAHDDLLAEVRAFLAGIGEQPVPDFLADIGRPMAERRLEPRVPARAQPEPRGVVRMHLQRAARAPAANRGVGNSVRSQCFEDSRTRQDSHGAPDRMRQSRWAMDRVDKATDRSRDERQQHEPEIDREPDTDVVPDPLDGLRRNAGFLDELLDEIRILRVAHEEGADIILVGDSPAGAVRRWLPKAIGLALATTAGQVAEQAEMPVVVVK